MISIYFFVQSFLFYIYNMICLFYSMLLYMKNIAIIDVYVKNGKKGYCVLFVSSTSELFKPVMALEILIFIYF